MWCGVRALLAILSCTLGVLVSDYSERLDIRVLPQSALLAAFEFASNTSLSAFEQQDYGLFPRSLGQILRHTNTKELHLRFSVGRWDAENWGIRPRHGTREGGTGVELWAWIEGNSDAEADLRWLTLTNALSGLFCASLNFIDSTKTIRPELTFAAEGHLKDGLHLLHGTLPHEVVCTENLTPILKLLPCKGKVGISSLLDGHKLFDATWQSMAVDVRPICSPQGDCWVEIQQTVDMVLDADRASRPSKDPIPRPLPIEEIACNMSKPYNGADTCFPETTHGKRSWSLSQVFGRSIQGSCPLSQHDHFDLHVNAPAERQIHVNSTGAYERKEDSFRLVEGETFDLSIDGSQHEKFEIEQPPLYAERFFTGPGQETGGVQAVLRNPSSDRAVEVVYLESLPWFMRLYMHTLRTEISSLDAAGDVRHGDGLATIQEMVYRPAIDRKRGSHLELRLTVPAMSRLTIKYEFEKAILRYTEYPPDANRGFDVAPAVVRVSRDGGASIYVRTTSLLLPLPTPDFSMPYNVIILTSTVIAMGFGSIFNLVIRRFVAADEVGESGLAVIRARLRSRLGMLKKKMTAGRADEKKVQ